jgi:hypothetical protein
LARGNFIEKHTDQFYDLIVVLAAIRMTFHAILEISDTFLLMLRADIRLVVFMTSVTTIACIVGWMAGNTGNNTFLAMIHGEGMLSIECSGSPRIRSMAGNTVRAKLASVFDRLGMTSEAGRIQSLKLTIFMAILTGDVYMRTRQREVGASVVKRRAFPIIRGMTSRAIRAKLTIVFIILLMARITIPRCSFEDIINMAFFTFNFTMLAFQFEVRQIMVKRCAFPVIRGMASRAILSEPALMFIILSMTRETILRRRL